MLCYWNPFVLTGDGEEFRLRQAKSVAAERMDAGGSIKALRPRSGHGEMCY